MQHIINSKWSRRIRRALNDERLLALLANLVWLG
jgi:hypothetical protein